MNARVLMQKPPATVHADDSLAQAAAVMSDHNCGAVVVVGPTGRAVAMLTERDLWRSALGKRRALAEVRVHQAMSSHLCTCGPDDDVARVVDAMSMHKVRRLSVVDADGHPLGIVLLDDIDRAACREADVSAAVVPGKGVVRTSWDIREPHLSRVEPQGRVAVAQE